MCVCVHEERLDGERNRVSKKTVFNEWVQRRLSRHWNAGLAIGGLVFSAMSKAGSR